MNTITASNSIDVSTIVSQLMSVERQPLTALQRRETQLQSKLTAFGRVQSALSTLQDAAARLRSNLTFQAAAASVSGDAATASASGGAVPGRFAVAVSYLARAQSSASAPITGDASATVGSGSLRISNAGGTELVNLTVAPTDTLASIRDRINAAGSDVRASIVADGGNVRLVLNSRSTGAANGFSVSADAGLSALAFTTTQAARDAQYSVNGLALTSASNTVTDAIAGVTLTLTKAPSAAAAAAGETTEAEVAVDPDGASVRTAAETFVNAYNGVMSVVEDLTKFNADTRTAATLNGEGVLRSLRSMVRGIVVDSKTGAAAGELTRLADVGIEIQSDGKLKLTAAKFDAAFTADPSKVARLFTDDGSGSAAGFGVRMRDLMASMIDPQGLLAARQEGLRDSVRRLDTQQEQLEARLAQTEKRLITQYSKLDALVSSRQQQSSALANALAGLGGLG